MKLAIMANIIIEPKAILDYDSSTWTHDVANVMFRNVLEGHRDWKCIKK